MAWLNERKENEGQTKGQEWLLQVSVDMQPNSFLSSGGFSSGSDPEKFVMNCCLVLDSYKPIGLNHKKIEMGLRVTCTGGLFYACIKQILLQNSWTVNGTKDRLWCGQPSFCRARSGRVIYDPTNEGSPICFTFRNLCSQSQGYYA